MPRRALLLLPAAVLCAAAAARAQSAAPPPYRDSALAVAARVADLLARMTPREKFFQLYMSPGDPTGPAAAGADYSGGAFGLQIPAPGDSLAPAAAARADALHIDAVQRSFVEHTRLGIPIVPFDEAVHGLLRPGATVFPQAIALAATWDSSLVARVAGAIAAEARARGIRQVLAPVVNVANDVRWGRVEETYGEDPYLASVMAGAYAGALERGGVIATLKHFVANVGEGGRDSYPIGFSPRYLAAEFYPPFRAGLAAGAGSVMTAYNAVDGVPATQNRTLLTDVLRTWWGFRGFVISDEAATGGAVVLHGTEPDTPSAARDAWEAGLDLVFQASYGQYGPYWDAVRRGLVPAAVVDSAVARVLAAKFALGLFEHPYVDPDAAARPDAAHHRALALDAARESLVLLKNARGTLPLSRTVRSIAVIGPDAAAPRLGDYSAPAFRPVSILEGIRATARPGTVVRYAPGPGREAAAPAAVPAAAFRSARGLQGQYFDNIGLAGAPVLTRADSQIDFRWTLSGPAPALARDWYSVRWTGTVTAPASGVRAVGVTGKDGWRLYLDGRLVLDRWRKQSAGTHLVPVRWAPGSAHAVRLEYFEPTGNGRIRLVWDAGPPPDWRGAVARAAALARSSAVAVVVAGIDEGEFADRASLALPGHQEDLIRAVAATGTPVVVVLIGGSAITVSRWIGGVGAVLDAWYAGEAGGTAVAEALFGDVNPAGRLPVTFPLAEGQLPLRYNHEPTGRGDDYVDLPGEPQFPFGFGLSYTRFEYSDLAIAPAAVDTGGAVRVSCRVRNAGPVAGDEVVQLYLRDVLTPVASPVERLAAFARVHLAPGRDTTVTFAVGRAALAGYDATGRRTVRPEAVRIMIGASSADIRLAGRLEVR